METFFQNEVFSRTILIKENGCTQNNDTEPATQSLILSLSLSQQSFVSEDISNTFTPNKMHILLLHTFNAIYENELEAQFLSPKFPLPTIHLSVNKALTNTIISIYNFI